MPGPAAADQSHSLSRSLHAFLTPQSGVVQWTLYSYGDPQPRPALFSAFLHRLVKALQTASLTQQHRPATSKFSLTHSILCLCLTLLFLCYIMLRQLHRQQLYRQAKPLPCT